MVGEERSCEMKQKFRAFTRVRVSKNLPPCMNHFPNDFTAIVAYSYSQRYGGEDVKHYSLYALHRGSATNHISWYPEETLEELPIQNRECNEEIVESYNLARK